MSRLEQVAGHLSGQGAILLREKDLPESDYRDLAVACKRIADAYHIPLIVHSHPKVAHELHTRLHLPMTLLEPFLQDPVPTVWGVSVHSADEAVQAQNRGASYVIAGHVFSTDCKKGVPPRGLKFLREVVEGVQIPVYAIGGITMENSREVLQTGAAGVCMMSHWMAGPLGQLPLPQR